MHKSGLNNFWLYVSLFTMALSNSASAEQTTFLSTEIWRSAMRGSISPIRQVVEVRADSGVHATMSVWQESNNGWRQIAGPWPAVLGKNGMAAPGQKKEGDGKTPAGLFALSLAFGSEAQPTIAFPYRQTTDKDIWIDDPQSSLYNKWSQLPTTARSFERMKRKDELYTLGLVVDYNLNPVVAGAGSAIFIHVWRNENKGTAGCVALEKKNLSTLVHALRRELNPAVLFLP